MTLLVLSSERYCACGCGASLAGRQANTRYVDGSHRARACKARAKSKPARRVKPSGLQISYRKAARVLAQELRRENDAANTDWPSEKLDLLHPGWDVREAEAILAPALSKRQRARLR